jgi:hypothetical protein
MSYWKVVVDLKTQEWVRTEEWDTEEWRKKWWTEQRTMKTRGMKD